MKKIGVVSELNLFAVKSMRGMSVGQVDCYWYGMNGDRKYGFVRADARSGFPWLTGRELPEMVTYEAYFDENGAVRVRVDGADWAVDSAELLSHLSQAYGYPVSLFKLKRGTFDAMPLSLMTERTMATVSERTGRSVDGRCFRSNIVVTGAADEQAWIGGVVRFGERMDSAEIRIDRPTQRCSMINIDPENGERSADVLKTVAQTMSTNAGVYATVQKPGTIQQGDTLYLLKP